MGTLHRVQRSAQKKSFLGFNFAETPQHSGAGAFTVSAESVESAHGEGGVVPQTLQTPQNLPTLGYDSYLELDSEVSVEDDHALTALENKAHEHRVLLSSDAMRYFVGQITSHNEQLSTLGVIAKKAHIGFPSEEGWVVLNLARMEDLLAEVTNRTSDTPQKTMALESTETFLPMRASSLAEAIVTKNIMAAYALISNRPMVALADAASDIDAVYRGRKGEVVEVSDMLLSYTRELSTHTLEELALALTSALDGTYNSEEEAVKMAILKAVQVLK